MKITAYTKMDITPITDLLPEDIRSSVQWIHCPTRNDLTGHLAETEVLLTSGRLEDDILRAAPIVRWVQTLSAGVDKVPLKQIAERNILLTNARGIHQIQMSEFALLYMLQWARRTDLLYRNQLNHLWDSHVPAGELYGGTLGVLGSGSIGEAIALKGKAFGMTTIGYNRSGSSAPGFDRTYAGPEGLETVLQQSDYVVMLLPSTPETRHFMSMDRFRLMKPSAFFINLARGSVVNEQDLTEALRTGVIAGAALDVFEVEPLPEESPLWSIPNLFITPHTAGLSPKYMQRAGAIVVENIGRFLRGESLINTVDPKEGY